MQVRLEFPFCNVLQCASILFPSVSFPSVLQEQMSTIRGTKENPQLILNYFTMLIYVTKIRHLKAFASNWSSMVQLLALPCSLLKHKEAGVTFK